MNCSRVTLLKIIDRSSIHSIVESDETAKKWHWTAIAIVAMFLLQRWSIRSAIFQISLRANLFKALNYISSSSCNDGVKPAWCLPTYKKVFTTKDENLEPKITISTLPLRMPKRRHCHLQNLAVVV